jgi:tetrapyrrole methylase family protein/MazG family protein/ATP diphosphatase
MPRPAPSADLPPMDRLLAIMARLRDRADGCPWDVEQTFETIAPYTVEEAYEVADAAERGDLSDLRDELGDLLLQVVFHARMAEEQGAFAFDDVGPRHQRQDGAPPPARLRRRNLRLPRPPEGRLGTAEGGRAGGKGKAADASLLDDVPVGLPASRGP